MTSQQPHERRPPQRTDRPLRAVPESDGGDLAWLVAYALGLAYTERPDHDCARLLAHAGSYDPEELALVRGALRALRLPRTSQTERAHRLVDDAVLEASGARGPDR